MILHVFGKVYPYFQLKNKRDIIYSVSSAEAHIGVSDL